MTEYEKIRAAAEKIENICGRIDVTVVLGSGLGSYAEKLNGAENIVTLPYSDIPGFPVPTVQGHAGKLIVATLNGKRIAFMSGRFHIYEGHSPADVVLPVRALREAGMKHLVVTNASGGINLSLHEGSLMLITDHINLSGTNPLIGRNIDELGPRFPDMTNVYTRDLQVIARDAALEKGIELSEGVYCMLSGPSYETPAEIRMLRALGADAVGMSTVPEAITASHMGIQVLGISCITNMAAGVLDRPLCHQEVIESGKRTEKTFSVLMDSILEKITAQS